MRLLFADADASLAESLCRQLTNDHFAVQFASSGDNALRFLTGEPYDAAILDLSVLVLPGLELLRRIRITRPNLAVLVTMGSGVAEDRIRAPDAGADDCLTKPFVLAELAARIRAVLRRGQSGTATTVLTVSDLALDRVSHTVERRGRSLDLSPREFALLEFLMRHAGQPVARAAIVEQVWKMTFETTTNVVDVYINYLRRKVDSGHDRALIRTIRGIGYQIGGNGAAC
jgi:two-component system, OmpR family, response regulator